MRRLKIATYPMKIAWADREENLRAVEACAAKVASDTDILVLPELFSTGFMQDVQVISALAEPINGETITALKALSRRYGFAIAGSFLCRVGEKFYNRCFFIEPSGEETYYDKRHLFSLSMEHEIFTSGDKLPPVIRYRGWNISLIVCYDLRFPVWCRNRRQNYDLMIVPANWPTSRGYAWKQLLIARGIENQSVIVGANRGGSDDFGDYDDLSFIVNGLGKIVSTPDPATGIIYADVDRDELAKIREKLPFGNDADDFSLECPAY
ncbi:MAG: nitrilase family protein [Barnesiella sp.]|nr:nitrilase family protein [Bacteroidales bacterium]MBD5247123.1 nitrilase family protein [Barnesiella sp.]